MAANIPVTSEQRVVAACMKADVVPFLIGDPAFNKSVWIEANFAAWGWHVETVVPSYHDQSEFNGLPVVNTNTWSVDMAAPSWAKRANAAKQGAIIFLDEWTMASDQVKGAAMRALRERWIGELKIANHVRFILAGNDVKTSAGGWHMPAPAANRMLHLDWTPVDYLTWTDGLLNGWDTITPDPFFPDEPTEERRLNDRLLVAGFIRHSAGTALHVLPTDRAEQGGPWASRRTWEMIADVMPYLAPITTRQGRADVKTLAEAAVGRGLAGQFLTWAANADLPDPREVLADPSIVNWADTSRMDRLFMVLAATQATSKRDNTKESWLAQWAVFAAAARAGRADVAASMVISHVRSAQAGWMPPMDTVRAFAGPLRAAGLAGAGR